MTNQELFDIALTSLRTQGLCSIAGGGCRYRGPNGAKCAIGWAIPNDLYAEDLEGQDARQLLDYSRVSDVLQGIDPQMAQRLQRAHDFYLPLPDDMPEPTSPEQRTLWRMKEGRGMDLWEAEMKSIAVEFNLNYTEPAA